MSTTGEETADSEERRRKQNMAKARLNYYSHNLKLRLQYAQLKVDHGWQRQTLSEVENLYFRHSRRPYPPVNPRKTTSSFDSNHAIASEHHPVASSSTPPPNLPSTPPPSLSDSFGGLTRSDTLQTIPDTSVTSTAQSSFQSTAASGSFDIPRIPIPPSLESYMAATMSPPRPFHDASMECRTISPPPCSRTLVRPPPHPQLYLADPNIDPSLVSVPATPPTHPSPPKPPLSTATPGGVGPPQPPPTSQPLTRVPTLPPPSSPAPSIPPPSSPAPSIPPTASSLPSIHRSTPSRPPHPSPQPQLQPHPRPTPQTRPAPPSSHRPLAPSTPGGKKPYRPIQPAPMKPSPNAAFGSPLTYDSFWSSHQSSVSNFPGLRTVGSLVGSGGGGGGGLGRNPVAFQPAPLPSGSPRGVPASGGPNATGRPAGGGGQVPNA